MLARSGRANQAGFEGGQMPLARRLPKRGFTNIFRVEYSVINLKDLVAQEKTMNFNLTIFRDIGLIKGRNPQVKILGSGEIDRPIVVEAHKFSDSARQKIENAGGQAKVIGRA
jgi:large subunit ribosomal protein L15